MTFLRRLLCSVAALAALLPGVAWAQWATVEGRVDGRPSAQPIEGAHVVLDDLAGTRTGTATARDGRYRLDGLRPGRYALSASYVGYATHHDTLTLGFGEARRLDVVLVAEARPAPGAVVESDRIGPAAAAAGLVSVHPSALERVPMPGLAPDLAAYLATMPGVVSTGDRGGQLFIRGGTPAENLILVDGMPLYQPFHVVGFYSAFPADVVAYADVYAGGYGARYGGRLSSVIDVVTRNGDKRRVAGAASVAPFLATLRLEVPLVPEKVSVLATARESVVERLGPPVLGREMPFRFGDAFAKLHAYLSRTSSFAATLLRTHDRGELEAPSGEPRAARWTNAAYGARYSYLPSEQPVLAEVAVFASQLRSRYRPTPSVRREADVDGIGADIRFTYLLGEQQVAFGLFGRTYGLRYDFGSGEGPVEEHVTEGGGFVEVRLRRGPWTLEPGLRTHGYSNGIRTPIEPRLRLAWEPSARHTLAAAWGLYHQQITGLSSLRDVADVFVAWTPVPRRTTVPGATHLIGSWQMRPASGVAVTVEGYRRSLADGVFVLYTGDAVGRQVLERLDGAATGLDVRLEVARPPFHGSAGYGLARVWYRADDGAVTGRFHPPHDRRHQLHLVAGYTRGLWRVSLQWQFGSGRPFTRINGFYDRLAPDDRTGEGYHTDPGTPTLVSGEPFGGRLPPYHRLDAVVERTFRLPGVEATLQAGAVNVYDRRNLFDYDLFSGRRSDQLPFIPSLGLKVAF